MLKIDKEVLEKIRMQVKELSKIDEDNLEERIKQIPICSHEIFIRFTYESIKLAEMDLNMKKEYGRLYLHYKYNDDRSWDTKGEIESQIYANSTYQELWRDFNKKKYVVKELEGLLKNIHNLSYSIKEFIAYIKFKAGVY